MVQEYLEGQTLRDALTKRALPLHQALALAAEVGEALEAAHAANIVHRDLKPDNIFITEAGHAKVLDSHQFPDFLPDGRILFTSESAESNARAAKDIAVLDPDTPFQRPTQNVDKTILIQR